MSLEQHLVYEYKCLQENIVLDGKDGRDSVFHHQKNEPTHTIVRGKSHWE